MAALHTNLKPNEFDAEYSESSSYTDSNSNDLPQKKVKDYCRKLITFMCTQVGVGGLIVGYAVMGAIGFQLIEKEYNDIMIVEIPRQREISAEELWNITKTINTLDKVHWRNKSEEVLLQFQEKVTWGVKNGYSGKPVNTMWTFPGALMFCLSVFTMIGYGNLVPRTIGGKVATMVYAGFGIPLYVLYFKNMGKFLAHIFRWSYTWVYRCSMEDHYPYVNDKETPKKRVIVPSTACLWVLFAYVATGTIMFSSWQSWSVMDSVYFCVTSLCKIGIGDFAPDNIFVSESEGGKTTRLMITFFYLLFGMGIIAMCFDLMKEDVTVRIRKLKSDISVFFEDIRIRAIEFYQRRSSIDSY